MLAGNPADPLAAHFTFFLHPQYPTLNLQPLAEYCSNVYNCSWPKISLPSSVRVVMGVDEWDAARHPFETQKTPYNSTDSW